MRAEGSLTIASLGHDYVDGTFQIDATPNFRTLRAGGAGEPAEVTGAMIELSRGFAPWAERLRVGGKVRVIVEIVE